MELIDIYNENNEYLGYSLNRDEVHEKNLWHRHVSSWIMNEEGNILLFLLLLFVIQTLLLLI